MHSTFECDLWLNGRLVGNLWMIYSSIMCSSHMSSNVKNFFDSHRKDQSNLDEFVLFRCVYASSSQSKNLSFDVYNISPLNSTGFIRSRCTRWLLCFLETSIRMTQYIEISTLYNLFASYMFVESMIDGKTLLRTKAYMRITSLEDLFIFHLFFDDTCHWTKWLDNQYHIGKKSGSDSFVYCLLDDYRIKETSLFLSFLCIDIESLDDLFICHRTHQRFYFDDIFPSYSAAYSNRICIWLIHLSCISQA